MTATVALMGRFHRRGDRLVALMRPTAPPVVTMGRFHRRGDRLVALMRPTATPAVMTGRFPTVVSGPEQPQMRWRNIVTPNA